MKNGVTLNLSGVDWQVTGTDLVGDDLAPASYQAVATYSGQSYYKAATGYVTTVDYVGEISRDGVESITYQVMYLGTEGGKIEAAVTRIGNNVFPSYIPHVIGGLALAVALGLTVKLLRSRQGLQEEDPEEHEQEDDT